MNGVCLVCGGEGAYEVKPSARAVKVILRVYAGDAGRFLEAYWLCDRCIEPYRKAGLIRLQNPGPIAATT